RTPGGARSKVMVTATVGEELVPLLPLLPADEHGDWPAEPLVPVPVPPPPGQVATVPTDCPRPPTAVVPSGSTTDTPSPGLTRFSWVTSRSTVTAGVVPVAVSTVPPPPPPPPPLAPPPPPPTGAPADGVTEVIGIGPGSNTTSPSRISPVTGSPREACQRPTAAAVAGE